jgi:hypothetical protein
MITFIANSGIQFYRFEAPFDEASQRSLRLRYIERFDSLRKRFWLDEAIPLGNDGLWGRRQQLQDLGLLDGQGRLLADADLKDAEVLDQSDLHESGGFKQLFKHFERRWLPLPFFKRNNIHNDSFGPTDWVRIHLERSAEGTLRMVLAVDTTTARNEGDLTTPALSDNPNENIFALCGNDSLSLGFADPLMQGEWVEKHLEQLVHPPQADPEPPFLSHVALYLFLLRYLRSVDQLPAVQLLSDRAGQVNVDLVLDVGNSNTCALLFEEPTDQSFNLNTVKQLEIQDLSEPQRVYTGSFSTRVVFREADLGTDTPHLGRHNKFQWPSPARVGTEAERHIHQAGLALHLAREVRSYNSSPKRYLWDTRPSPVEWEYHQTSTEQPPRKVYKQGISEQLKADGSPCEDGVSGLNPHFSRRSLMTFVYLEVLCHALRQINSVEFRSQHGNPSARRRLRRIVISCPTAMLRSEQVALRACADEALTLLNNYTYHMNGARDVNDILPNIVEVLPSPKDIALPLDQLERRKDWIHDEATCAQLVLLYGMVRHKFEGNARQFMEIYGKPASVPGGRTLTVGSLDIGAGTSDLMICRYTAEGEGLVTLNPDPLFWESFDLAGDDLLKVIIQEVVIEGAEQAPEDRGCTGRIEQHARTRGIPHVARLLNGFFGHDSNNMGYKGRLLRVSFINQVAIPIALRYMEHANTTEDRELTYEGMFPDKQQRPTAELLDQFARHFGFRFEEITWRLAPGRVNALVESVFERLVQQVSRLMHRYGCDLVVLSGRPNAFKSLERLFLRHNAMHPGRLVNMNDHWIGRWYPFADNNGFVADQKPVVAVGALIALMGGSLHKLDRFRIDTTKLRTRLVSTADHIGPYHEGKLMERLLAPGIDEAEMVVHAMPYTLGAARLPSTGYPARPLCKLVFNDERITEHAARRRQAAGPMEALEQRKGQLLEKLPFRVTIARDPERDKEQINIVQVTDRNGDDIPKTFFDLRAQTLPNDAGHWLDTGEFILNIRD